MVNIVKVNDPIDNDRPVAFTVTTTAMQAIELRTWMNRYAKGGDERDCPTLVWDILDGLRAGMRAPGR